jgi:hypothetical protein
VEARPSDRRTPYGLGTEQAGIEQYRACGLHAHRLNNELKPDVVVTEQVPKYSTKGANARALIETIADITTKAKLLDIRVRRPHDFPNKYTEAQHLGIKFPEIAQWVPRPRRLWEPEPRVTVVFEALGMIVTYRSH